MDSRDYPLIFCVSATAVAGALVIYGVVSKSVPATRGAYLFVLIALFALMFTLFLERLLSGGRLSFESNWGAWAVGSADGAFPRL
jgi:hypothetical protein